MPICIAGMPCSGMSMVGRAITALGVDLGTEPERSLDAAYTDRPHLDARFTRINDAILDAAGAAWNSPPQGNGSWTARPELDPLKREARIVSDALALAEPWGWVDPANSLTLPFWRELFPDLQILVCVRHPLELAQELESEGAASSSEALELWRAYYEAVEELGAPYVITDRSRYNEDAHGELERLARELHLSPSHANLTDAAAVVAAAGSAVPSGHEVPPEVRGLYARLLDRADHVDRPASIAEQKLEIAHLRRELERARGGIEDLRAQVEAHAGWQRERDDLLANLEQQLLERDEDLKRAREENEWRRGKESALREENEWLREIRSQFESMQQTHLWRLGAGYWSFRDRVREALRRSR